jgi:aspartate-semialdehyde dehydrogenase
MEEGIPLVVPEVNASVITIDSKIIANPNCSTIQMVVALKPLNELYKIKRLVIATYQSYTGTGKKAVDQYQSELDGKADKSNRAYPHPIFENCLPHCDVFFDNGYTKEELKLENETRKIMNEPDMKITATAVRVPVHGGHSESVNIEFDKAFELADVVDALTGAPGIIVKDDPANNIYPMPLDAHNRDEVFVGRIRRDYSIDNGINIWIVSDNLRKGAATNAVQIAEYLIDKVI